MAKCKNCRNPFVQTRRDFDGARHLWPEKSLRDFCSPECKEAANWRSNHAADRKYKKLKRQGLKSYKNFIPGKDPKTRKSSETTCCFFEVNPGHKSGSETCYQVERKFFGISWFFCKRDSCWYPESHCRQMEVR